MRAMGALAVLLCMALACDNAPKRAAGSGANHGLMGFIDSPAAGSTVGPAFLVAGWAVGREGVDRVRLYLDDELIATTPLNVARPDIDREYPRYAGTGPNHGFTVTIDAGRRSGFRMLRIEAIDRRGTAAHVASITVKIEP